MTAIDEKEIDVLLKDAVKTSELNLQEKDFSSEDLMVYLTDGITLRCRYWNLKVVNISNCNITLRGLELLTSSLSQLKTMESFIAQNAGITKEAGIYLAKLLTNSSGLKTLDLCNNQLGDIGLTSLCQAFAENITSPQIDFMSIFTLKSIYLAQNDIGDAGILAFCRALIHYSKRLQNIHRTFRVKTLSFARNKLTDKAAYCLAQLLNAKITPTPSSSSSPMRGQSMNGLAKGLKFNMIVEELFLDDNINLGSKGISTLLGNPFQMEISPVRVLSISRCGLDFSLLAYVAHIIVHNPVHFLETLAMEFTEEMAHAAIQTSGHSYDPIYGNVSPNRHSNASSSSSSSTIDLANAQILHLSMKHLVDALLNITHKQTVHVQQIRLGQLPQCVYEHCVDSYRYASASSSSNNGGSPRRDGSGGGGGGGGDFVYIDCKKTLEFMNPASDIFGVPYISNIDAWIAGKQYQNVMFMTTSNLRKLNTQTQANQNSYQHHHQPQQQQQQQQQQSIRMGGEDVSSSSFLNLNAQHNSALLQQTSSSGLVSSAPPAAPSMGTNNTTMSAPSSSSSSSTSTTAGGVRNYLQHYSALSNNNNTNYVNNNPQSDNDTSDKITRNGYKSTVGSGSNPSNNDRNGPADVGGASGRSKVTRGMEDSELHNYSLLQMQESEYLKMRQDHSNALQSLSSEISQLVQSPATNQSVSTAFLLNSNNPPANNNPASRRFDNLMELAKLPNAVTKNNTNNSTVVTTASSSSAPSSTLDPVKALLYSDAPLPPLPDLLAQLNNNNHPNNSANHSSGGSNNGNNNVNATNNNNFNGVSTAANNNSNVSNYGNGNNIRSAKSIPIPNTPVTNSDDIYSNYTNAMKRTRSPSPTRIAPGSNFNNNSNNNNNAQNNVLSQLTSDVHNLTIQQQHFEDFLLSRLLALEQNVQAISSSQDALRERLEKLENRQPQIPLRSRLGDPRFRRNRSDEPVSDEVDGPIEESGQGAHVLVLNELWQKLHMIEKSMLLQQQQQQQFQQYQQQWSGGYDNRNPYDSNNGSGQSSPQSVARKHLLARVVSNNNLGMSGNNSIDEGYAQYQQQSAYYDQNGGGYYDQAPSSQNGGYYYSSSGGGNNNYYEEDISRSATPTYPNPNSSYDDAESLASLPATSSNRRARSVTPSRGSNTTTQNSNSVAASDTSRKSSKKVSYQPPADLPPFPATIAPPPHQLDQSTDMFATTLRPQSAASSNNGRKSAGGNGNSSNGGVGYMMPTRSTEFKRNPSNPRLH